ncbi:hypothetical protein ABH935_004041 [Catenulispora sp. GAS73]|uniref:protein kinase domain-containing protein n=1 Tax=Catenulispora sp. GAS73 TaxID=3156269 RepID=UPI0035117228
MRNGLVEGVSLRAVLRESEAMTPEAAASVLAGMLVTLAVVHGDVRPEHVRVNGSGGIALTDFAGPSPRFVPNAPTYLAPERLRGEPASAAGDVFSATAVFFECLTNENTFVAATRDDLEALYEYAEIIAEFAPPQVSPLVQRGLAMHPSRRPSSPHEFLDEVTTAVTAAYGPDWQQRGQALLSEWAAAAARTEGVELAVPRARAESLRAVAEAAEAAAAAEALEAPPVGEPIDEALLGLGDEDAAVVAGVGSEAEEMPPPMGEPIDAALLGLGDDEGSGGEDSGGEVAAEESVEPEIVPVAEPEDAEDHDWFSRSSKANSAADGQVPGPEGDVLTSFDGARAGRSAESAPVDFTPTGFDVFADRSGESAAEADAEAEPVSGHWDEPEVEHDAPAEVPAADEDPAGLLDAEASGEEETAADAAASDDEPAGPDTDANANAEGDGDGDGDSEFEPLMEDSELFAAFDAFSPPAAAEETPVAVESEGASAEPLPKRDPFAGLGIETLAAASLLQEGTDPAGTEAPAETATVSEAEDSDSAPASEPEPEPELAAEADPEAASEAASEADSEAAPEPESADPDPEPDSTSRADLEDDWVFPTKPSPKAPRSLSAFAVSLPSLPRPSAEAEEPAPPVQTSAPDDWFRPGVTEAVGADADHTRVINPDRDNTIEAEATRTLDEVPAEVASTASAASAASAKAAGESRSAEVGGGGRGRGPVDDDEFDEPGAAGGPRRKTLIGAVTTAVLLVAGAAAVVLGGGSGNSPQGTSGTPTESSTSAPSPTVPSTPVGTDTVSGDGTTSTTSTPSTRHTTSHSRSHTPSPTTSTHSSSDETPTHSSSSQTPTDHPTSSTSSTTPTSTGSTSPTPTCSVGILGICAPTSTSKPQGGN